MKNWAIVIGINDYDPNSTTPLKYARQDAELIQNLFHTAGFDQVWFFSDQSSDVVLSNGVVPTSPTYGNLMNFLHHQFKFPFLSAGDNCWFFFAGHGERYQGQEYLMPQDCTPENIERTAIPISYVRERLCCSGAGNVILILDACRNEGGRSSTGIGSESQQGVITIFSCSPTQKAWEIDELQHGAFTYALHEAFQISGEGNCATVERLDHYLKYRVPELCQRYRKFPEQMPWIAPEPREKSHFILLPQYATSADIATLKNEAYRLAFMKNKTDLAEQFCIRANVAAMGRDLEIMDLYVKIKNSQSGMFLDNQSGIKVEVSQRSENSATFSTFSEIFSTFREIDEDELSETEIKKYARLRDFLKAQKWRQADEETQNLILKIAKRVKAGWLQPGNIDKLPCNDLYMIDKLWTKYSQEKFGFSIQKKIYAECGGIPDGRYDNYHWSKFCHRVGWMTERKWTSYSSFAFDLSAPVGQFPSGVRVRPEIRQSAADFWQGALEVIYGYLYIEETNLIDLIGNKKRHKSLM